MLNYIIYLIVFLILSFVIIVTLKAIRKSLKFKKKNLEKN